MKMEEGWVWFRCRIHKAPRLGYLKVDQYNGAKMVIVPHRIVSGTVAFRYDMKDIVHLEPLPPKIEFKLRLKDQIKDFRYKDEIIKA